MEYHKKYFGMKTLESRVLNETTTVVRFKKGVLHLIHHDDDFKTQFFEEVPNYFLKKICLQNYCFKISNAFWLGS